MYLGSTSTQSLGAWDSVLSGPEGKRTDNTLKSGAWRQSQSSPLTEFLTGQTWKQLRYPSVGERIHKLCSIMRCGVTQHWEETSYPAMKRHGGAFSVSLSERSQSERATCDSNHMISGKGETMETEKISGFPGLEGEETNRWNTEDFYGRKYSPRCNDA